jgi:hypothetical protein
LKVTEEFRVAEVLAAFANLDRENLVKVKAFRNDYPDFAPAEWWDYKFTLNELVPSVMGFGDNPVDPLEYGAILDTELATSWHDTQSQVWCAWDNEFKFASVFVLTSLLRSVFVAPKEAVLTSANLYMSDGEFLELATPKMYGFHKAVLYLHHHPWRAKICKDCEKYFVARHPKREFCEYKSPDPRYLSCRHKNDCERKLKYYDATGREKRQKATKAATKKRRSNPRLPVHNPKSTWTQ